VDALRRNRWTASSGTGGRNHRNTQRSANDGAYDDGAYIDMYLWVDEQHGQEVVKQRVASVHDVDPKTRVSD
jgi:hypothetical protein